MNTSSSPCTFGLLYSLSPEFDAMLETTVLFPPFRHSERNVLHSSYMYTCNLSGIRMLASFFLVSSARRVVFKFKNLDLQYKWPYQHSGLHARHKELCFLLMRQWNNAIIRFTYTSTREKLVCVTMFQCKRLKNLSTLKYTRFILTGLRLEP